MRNVLFGLLAINAALILNSNNTNCIIVNVRNSRFHINYWSRIIMILCEFFKMKIVQFNCQKDIAA